MCALILSSKTDMKVINRDESINQRQTLNWMRGWIHSDTRDSHWDLCEGSGNKTNMDVSLLLFFIVNWFLSNVIECKLHIWLCICLELLTINWQRVQMCSSFTLRIFALTEIFLAADEVNLSSLCAILAACTKTHFLTHFFFFYWKDLC